MTYVVLVSRTFQKAFQELPVTLQKNIRTSLQGLKEDPLTARAGCDIKGLIDTHPRKYRLRVGDYRIIYLIEKKEVKVIDLIKREQGYSRFE
jgi:mRNA-degrading endonuclease RelE of RelBE toxin-antitoxin system